MAAADALLVCTPEYAGALPGALKNLLEWTGSGADRRWRCPRLPAQVLGYVGADIVEDACVRIPLARDMVDTDGGDHRPAIRVRIAATLESLARHVAQREPAE